MGELTIFLESSSINGLNHVAKTKNFLKFFWMFVVLSGFVGAGILMYQSFQSWSENPVSTITETLPISEITFPKVTVCPPKKTNTDLNYDLMLAENILLDNQTREELLQYAYQLLFEAHFNESLDIQSNIKESDKFYNWYQGFSVIQIPFFDTNLGKNVNFFTITSVNHGTVYLRNYGEKWKKNNVVNSFDYDAHFYVFPTHTNYSDTDILVSFNISILSTNKDTYLLDGISFDTVPLSTFSNTANEYFEKTDNSYNWRAAREDLSEKDLSVASFEFIPGFQISWSYASEVPSVIIADQIATTVAFVRWYMILMYIYYEDF